MSFQAGNPNDAYSQPAKKTNVLVVVLGILGGILFLLVATCCGIGLWLTSFPGVPPTASQPFEVDLVAELPAATSTAEEPIQGVGTRTEVVFGDGSGYGEVAGENSRIWIYKPAGDAKPKSLPCVMICGAGSTLLNGMQLGSGDEPEHLPYVKAGFVVIAYDLDGGDQDNPGVGDSEPSFEPYNAFRNSKAGLINAKNALEYTLKNVPEVNPNQIFTAGHSSAGTTALLFAEHEPRIAGVVAYAPVIDLQARLPGIAVRALSNVLPGLAEFIVRSSPRTHEANLTCPVMIFHAADDSNVEIKTSREFAERMKQTGKDVTLVEVPTGDHYQPMIDTGIAQGIDWMNKHRK